MLGSIIKVQAVHKCLQEYKNYILHLEFWEHLLIKHKPLTPVFFFSQAPWTL